MKSFVFLLAGVAILIGGQAMADPPVRLQATPWLLPLARDIVRPLHELGVEVKLVQDAGNNQVIADLGAGFIDAALITRRLNVDERVSYPEHHFNEIPLGVQVAAVVVSRQVWESGVHALNRDQLARVYQSKVRSWKELGGEERPLVFFEPPHDRGLWEMFADWTYGDLHRAPAVNWQAVADGSETQTTLQFASGGMSVANLRWADRKDVFPLGLIDDSGKTIEPTLENIVSGDYPMMCPIILAFADDTAAQRKKLRDFMVGEKGQSLVTAHEFLAESALKKP